MAISIANQLREARIQAGLTQAELAEKIGVARPTITQIEAGKPTTTATLEAWAVACKCEFVIQQSRSEVIVLAGALPRPLQPLAISLLRLLPSLDPLDRRTLALLVDGWNAAYPSAADDCQGIVKSG